MAIPMFAAYGIGVRRRSALPARRARRCSAASSSCPAVIGSAITLVLVNVFPARRTRDILSVIAVLAAGGIVLLFRLIRPERLARPEGFRSLVDFVAVLRTPTSPLLPSEWVQRAMLGWLNYRPDWLSVYLLWSTARRGVRARRAAAPLALHASASARRRRARSGSCAAGVMRDFGRPPALAARHPASASSCSRSCGSSSATRRSGRS